MKILFLLFIILFTMGWLPTASADTNCEVISNPTLSFGTIDPLKSETNTQGNLELKCSNNDWFHQSMVTLCVGIGADALGSVDPRHLYRRGGDILDRNDKINYNLFVNPARTQVWGNINEGEDEMFKTFFTIPARSSISRTITLYGRVFPGQATLHPGNYDYTASSGITRLYFTFHDNREGLYPESCITSTNNRQVPLRVNLFATIDAKCNINTASDLDFGTITELLNNNVDGQSQLAVTCTNGTAYKLALNNGLHYMDGQRRMSAGNNRFIAYELYQDSGRTLPWKDTDSNIKQSTGIGRAQTLMVYGRVYAQPQATAGEYNDTIMATITY